MSYILTAFWYMTAAAPPVTALRWDWQVGFLTNDTGTGTDTWDDQDVTDGQVNNITLNWDYTPVSPAPSASLVLGDWLIGHPRAFENATNSATDLFYGDTVTAVGVKDFMASMECRFSGAAETGDAAQFVLFKTQCFDEKDIHLMIDMDDVGGCNAWVAFGNELAPSYGVLVSIPLDSIVEIGILVEADGALNTNISVLVNNVVEDTFNVLNADIGPGIREQISGRTSIGIEDRSSTYQPGISLSIWRYRVGTL